MAKKKTKSKPGICDICGSKRVLQDGLCQSRGRNCAKNNDPYLHSVIDRYFSDAKKGALSAKGALYIEDSLVVHLIESRTKSNSERKKEKIKYIEKILRALSKSNSINMFYPLVRWACRLHPKRQFSVLEGGQQDVTGKYRNWEDFLVLKGFLESNYSHHDDWNEVAVAPLAKLPTPLKLYESTLNSLAKLDYKKGYPEVVELLLTTPDDYNHLKFGPPSWPPNCKDYLWPTRGIGVGPNSNLVAADILTKIGGAEIVDAFEEDGRLNQFILANLSSSGNDSVVAALSKIKNKDSGANRKIISTLLKNLNHGDLPTRRNAAITLMDAVDEPDLEILWKVTRAFLDWERDRAKHLKEQYGGEYR
jgi:hypothetical protein